jgi:hypothetical protein
LDHVPFLVDVIQELWAHPEQTLVAPLDETEGTPTTLVWRALPVHPKTAVLFFWGVPARETLFRAFAWYQWLPIGSQERLAPLLKFMLCAVMEDAANPVVSATQTTWHGKDPGELDAFKTWYYKLQAQCAPVHASSPEMSGGVLPVAPAVPPTASVDSVDKLADLLDARFRNNPDGQAMASETDKYNQYKIIILAGICGVPGDPNSWRNLSLEALPDFWTKIKGMRG